MMSARSLLKITGTDRVDFLQGLVTNDIAKDEIVYAALLTPQGKFIADFFVAGSVTATVGFNIHRGMVVVGTCYFVGAICAAFAPHLVLEVMAGTFLLAHLALAGTWRAMAREAQGGSATS